MAKSDKVRRAIAINRLFDKQKVNTGRQPEIDLSRGFTVFLLILCHVGLYLGDPSDTALYVFSDIIGSEWCAPVFMALMGTSVLYSRHAAPKDLLVRGAKLFAWGYLLSAFRSLLPLAVLGPIDEWASIAAFFVVDIFQFAGLSFMFLALLRKLKLPSWGILILSLAMTGIGQIYLSAVAAADRPLIENEQLAYVVNLFLPVTEWSCFPFIIWFFFPAFGLFFGEFLIHCKNKKMLYGILLPISLCGVIFVYAQFVMLYPDYTNYYFGGNFYYMGVANVLLTTLFILFSLSFWFFVDKILPKFLRTYLTFLGRNITVYYVISWILISVLIHVDALCGLTYGGAAAIGMMAGLIVLCSLLTKGYVCIRKKMRESQADA